MERKTSFDEIIDHVKKQQLDTLKLELKDFLPPPISKATANTAYIPLLASDCLNEREVGKDVFHELGAFLKSSHEVLVLWGDSGNGKSLTLKMFAYQLWLHYELGDSIPLWLPLGNVTNKTTILPNFFKGFCSQSLFLSPPSSNVLQKRSWCLILDGFEEISDKKNLYQENSWGNWQIKVIIGCRTQAIIGMIENYQEKYFEPTDGNRYQPHLLTQKFLLPFNEKQVTQYIEHYCLKKSLNNLIAPWDEPDAYLTQLKRIAGLDAVAKKPFMLPMVLTVIPELSQQSLQKIDDHYSVLAKYVQKHNERESIKLRKPGVNVAPSQDALLHFSEALATELFLEKHPIIYQPNINQLKFYSKDPSNPWLNFFKDESLIKSSLLNETSGKDERGNYSAYSFRHKSLLEYFVLEVILKQWQSDFVCIDYLGLASWDVQKLFNSLLNQRLITEEKDLRQGLADRLKSKLNRQKLLRIIQIAAAREDLSLISANAATLLNQQGLNFSGLHLPRVKFAGSDLTGSLFHCTCLANSDLRGVKFVNGFLGKADLTASRMEEVTLKQLPFLKKRNMINCVAYRPKGRWMVVASGSKISFYQSQLGQKIFELKGHTARVNSVAFSSDGKYLVSGGDDNTVRLWNVETGAQLVALTGHTNWVNSVAFSSDGKYLASGSDDNTVCVWDVGTYTFAQFTRHTHCVKSVAFSNDGNYLASGSMDKTICVWNVRTHTLLAVLTGHTRSVYSLAFSSDGKYLVSGSSDHTVRLWDMQTFSPVTQFTGHTGWVMSVAVSSDGKYLVSGSSDHTVRLWDMQTYSPVAQFTGHTGWVMSVAFWGDRKRLISGGSDHTVRLWDVEAYPSLSQSIGHTGWVMSVAFRSDGKRLASGSRDGIVRLWDRQTQALLAQFTHTSSVNSVAFSRDGNYLAAGTIDGTVWLWDVQTRALLAQFTHTSSVNSVAFSRDGDYLAAGTIDGTVCVWDVKTDLYARLTGHASSVNSVVFSNDGKHLASGDDDKTICLWDVPTYTLLFQLEGHDSSVKSVAISSDGERLASGGNDKTICLWDMQKYALLAQLIGHTGSVKCVAFSWDGNYLASGSWDTTVCLWDTQTYGAPLAQLMGHTDGVNSVAFSRNGKYLVSASQDHSIKLWRLEQKGDQLEVTLHWTTHHSLFTQSLNLSGVIGLSALNNKLLTQMGATDAPLARVTHQPTQKIYTDWSKVLQAEKETAINKKLTEAHPWITRYRKNFLLSNNDTQLFGQLNLITSDAYHQRLLILESIDSHQKQQCEIFYHLNRRLQKITLVPYSLKKILKNSTIQSCWLTECQFNKITRHLLSVCENIKNVLDLDAWLAEYLTKNSLSLTKPMAYEVIEVSQKFSGRTEPEEPTDQIYKIFRSSHHVKIRIQSTAEKKVDIECLSNALATCCDVSSIDLSRLYLNDDAALFLAKWLETTGKAIKALRLSHNQINCKGLKCLLEGAAIQRNLMHLWLDYNHIQFDADFAEHVLTPLLLKTSIKNLDVSMNYILSGQVAERPHIKVQLAQRGIMVRIYDSKANRNKEFGEQRSYCKTLFQKEPCLQSLCLGSIASIMNPELKLDEKTAVVGLFAYKSAGVFSFLADEHAFLVVEGIKKWGQRYLLMGKPYTNSKEVILIQLSLISPEDLLKRMEGLDNVHHKSVLVSRNEIKALKNAMLDFKNKANQYHYTANPKHQCEYSSLRWALEMLRTAKIIKQREFNSWKPSW